ncbi:hypothetical protein QJS10_CPB17g00018 [Acorus calamus]|uniref:RNase H type-1 domain-containing protein n=1 Tax=Acorus calamus TaxID=4465 RepID=A0AAV9CTC4_ACOCL|nr:hypothetical protein QJS10_CPB17g00018 [Acorus calamus]
MEVKWVEWTRLNTVKKKNKSDTRNDKSFKGASGDPRVTAGKAFSLADECRRLLAHMDAPLKCIQKVPRESFDVSISRCPAGVNETRTTYVITDGSVDVLSRAAGAGFVVVQNKPFKVVGAGYSSWLWASPLRAEGEAIRHGVLFARKKTTGPICICSDAEVIVQLIQQAGPGPPPLQDIVKDIRNSMSLDAVLCAIKVERGHVIASEALAKYARRTQESKITDHLEDDVIRGSGIFLAIIA